MRIKSNWILNRSELDFHSSIGRTADCDLGLQQVRPGAERGAGCGRRPIAAFGNSDGNQPMLEWTTAGSGARFGLIVHHTDAEREWAYDRQ
jgi:hypothetical protein